VLWEGEWRLARETRAGRPILQLDETGQGIREGPGVTAWTEGMHLDLWGPHPTLTASREVRDADGRLVSRGRRDFDFALGAGQQVRQEVQADRTTVRAAPAAHPAGSWSAPPATLALLLVLAALVFVLGVECGAFWFPALRVRAARAKGDEE
jgi:hypothetical protein